MIKSNMHVLGYELSLTFRQEADAAGCKYEWTAESSLGTLWFDSVSDLDERVGKGIREETGDGTMSFSVVLSNDKPDTVRSAAILLKDRAKCWFVSLGAKSCAALVDVVKENAARHEEAEKEEK